MCSTQQAILAFLYAKEKEIAANGRLIRNVKFRARRSIEFWSWLNIEKMRYGHVKWNLELGTDILHELHCPTFKQLQILGLGGGGGLFSLIFPKIIQHLFWYSLPETLAFVLLMS